MRQKIFNMVYILALAAVLLTGVILLSMEDFDRVRAIEGDGTYLLHLQELTPRETPDILTVDDGKIFVYYVDTELVNAYSVSGDFLYGLQFPDYQNGRSDMTCRDGLLYVDARGSGIYVFRGTELQCFEEQHYQNSAHKELGFVFTGEEDREDSGCTYYYVEKENRIMRRGGDAPETVIQFPERKLNEDVWMMLFTAIVTVGYLWSKKEKLLFE